MNNFLIYFRPAGLIFILFLSAAHLTGCTATGPDNDHFEYAKSRADDLKLSVYVTAHAAERLLSTEAGKREALSLMKANGISRIYLEVYRSGLVVPPELLQKLVHFFKRNDFGVTGGIATVPGDTFGVRQQARYGWFNWENEKTQRDLKEVMTMAAPLFDSFIVDDFLCTADTSLESEKAKGNRSWAEYRRDLLTRLSSSIFIDPVKEINPDIEMIIKYPQWYDRYHLFGYDVVKQNKLYDKVYVGTEARGQYTPRFGYVQPYESFISYRWMSSLAGEKMAGAWFDHIDCNDVDFLDQAYQSVLAGAQELILFNYFNFIEGHRGQHLLRMHFQHLADLARVISKGPVTGVPGYKPPDSDAGGDLYVMDFIGMFGIPLDPVSQYPEKAKTVFLPTQAAADAEIFNKIQETLDGGGRVIITSGFLANMPHGEKMAEMAGLSWPVVADPFNLNTIMTGDNLQTIDHGLDLEADLKTAGAEVLLSAGDALQPAPFLTINDAGNIVVMNCHTFSQSDFDAVGEVLLCPRPLGLLNIPENWSNKIREVFNQDINYYIDAPSRVSFQPFGDGEFMLHNYNKTEENISLVAEGAGRYMDVLTGEEWIPVDDTIDLNMAARSRVWLKPRP